MTQPKHEDWTLTGAIQRAKANKYQPLGLGTHGDSARTVGLRELRDLRLIVAEFLRKEAKSGD